MRNIPQKFSIGSCKGFLASFLLAACAVGSAVADPVQVSDKMFTWTLDNGQATLYSYNATKNAEVTVPDSVVYNGTVYRVTAFGAECFNGTDATKVVMGKYVTRLEDGAFFSSDIETIVFSPCLEYIGSQVFRSCSSLTELDLPASLVEIGPYAFQQTGLKTLALGPKVKSIDPYALFRIQKLASITVSGDNPSFKADDDVLYTKDGTQLILCPAMKSGMSFTVPATVKKVWPGAFNYLNRIRELTLSEGVEELGDEVFRNSKLTTLTIPASLRYIGSAPFYSCTTMTTINIASGNQWFEVKDSWFVDKGQKKLVLHLGEYPADVVIPDGIAELGDQLFVNSKITSVTFPASLHKIGPYCFQNCQQLTQVKGSVENIDTLMKYAFWMCPNLTDYKFTSKLRYIGEGAFSTGSLTTVVIPESVDYLGRAAFERNSALTTFSLTRSPSYLGPSLCNACPALQQASLPEGLRTLPAYTFANCSNLKQFKIPATVDTIGDLAFYQSGLESLELPASVKYLSWSAFYECTNLKEIIIPDNVEYIGRSCFNRCSGVTSVKIGKGVKFIDEYAFNPLNSLVSLELSEGLERIGKAAFANCPLLRELTLPSTLTHIDTVAFANDSLTFIRAKMLTPPALKGVIFTNSNKKNPNPATDYATCILEVPQESLELYKNAEVWKEFVNLRGDGVEGIGNDADVTVREIFTVTGLRLSAPAPGQINILRMSDGSVRKVFIPR